LCGTASFGVFYVKIGARVLAVGDWKNQKQKQKIAETEGVRKIAHAQKRNPLSELYNILHGGTYP